MRTIALVFVLAVFASVSAAQVSGTDEQKVLKANEAFDKAVVDRDIEAYDRIVADDFVFTDFKGNVTDKKQEIEKLRSRKIKFIYGRSSEVRVKLYGSTAVVTGRFDAKLTDAQGKESMFAERYTAVFYRHKGNWRMVAEQSTEIVN